MAAFPDDFREMVTTANEQLAELDRDGIAPQHDWRELVRAAAQAKYTALAIRLSQRESLMNTSPGSHAYASTSSQIPVSPAVAGPTVYPPTVSLCEYSSGDHVFGSCSKLTFCAVY
jgi:hypothetical protein